MYKLTITNVTSKDSGEYKCQDSYHQIEQVLYKIIIIKMQIFYDIIIYIFFSILECRFLVAPKKFEEKSEEHYRLGITSTPIFLPEETMPMKFEENSEELSNSINVAGKNIGSSLLPTNYFASLTLVYLVWILDL